MARISYFLAVFLLFSTFGCSDNGAATSEGRIELTFLGVTQWLARFDDTTVMFDAYLSRPSSGALSSTEDGMRMLARVMAAEGVDTIDYIFIGHTHFDHAIDAGTAALETGAQLVGSQSTCFLAEAQGLPTERCTVVGTGDELQVGTARVRTMRTIHFLPDSIGEFGVYENIPPEGENLWAAPNGGAIAFLLSLPDDGPSLFYQNTLADLGDDDMSGEDYAANLNTLFSGADGATLWMTAANFAEDRAALDGFGNVVRPSFVMAHHWDGLLPDLEAGVVMAPDIQAHVRAATDGLGATLVVPNEYFERWELTSEALAPAAQSPVRDAFGL